MISLIERQTGTKSSTKGYDFIGLRDEQTLKIMLGPNSLTRVFKIYQFLRYSSNSLALIQTGKSLQCSKELAAGR
jgi:hypothetical protein